MTITNGLARLAGRIRRPFSEKILGMMIREKWTIDQIALSIDPRLFPLYATSHRHYFSKLHRFPNLIEPTSFNDRIQWLMLFDQEESRVTCSDKYEVRDFVKARVGEQYLTQLYGVHDSFDDVDFDALPQSFVIKATHDSGTVFLVDKSQGVDTSAIGTRMRVALDKPYGVELGEWAYALIKPRVMVEEYLTPKGGPSPDDFKLHCVDGRVVFIQYMFGRRTAKPREIVLTRNWERLPVQLFFQVSETDVAPPPNFDEMIRIAEALSAEFKYVRVDLYNIDGRIVFGELTFFPVSGSYPGYAPYQLGQFMTFDLASRKPPISDGLRRLR